MQKRQSRAWAEISLDAIAHNYHYICAQAQSPVLCVIKADAYGHGALQVAHRLSQEGAAYFAVATIDEGLALRRSGIKTPLLLLGYADQSQLAEAILAGITLTVDSPQTAQQISAAAAQVKTPCVVHFKIDTGMTRLGFAAQPTAQTVEQILRLAALPYLSPEGIFTHFAVADTPAMQDYTELQFARFSAVCQGLKQAGLDLPLRHCANSAGILYHADKHLTMVRAGIILYGLRPDLALPPLPELRPAMTVKARVAQVRALEAGVSVSYGCTFQTTEPTRVAVITMGYADGLLRTGSGKAHILIDGRPAPILGRICMDMCMAAVPDGVSLSRGDEVTIFGPAPWTADEAAAAAGTINYEVLCAISPRVPRIYVDR